MGKKGKYNNKAEKEEEESGKKKKFMISEQHLMDKNHMDTTEFLPFLPVDSMYYPFKAQEQAVRKILKDLNYLLYLDFKSFWATLLYNPSLKNSLTTCLQFFHRKWLNNYTNQQLVPDQHWLIARQSETYEYIQELMKVILFIFFRMVHCKQQNPELTTLYKLDEEVTKKYLINIPRLLELIEIYGKSNHDIVKTIIKQYTKNKPQFYGQFTNEHMEILLTRMNKNVNMLKRISDREEFGIQYSYKRTQPGQLSPGEDELKKKICLLLEVISFYEILQNVLDFFPENCADFVRFHTPIHTITQNTFIEIDQAYKKWQTHTKPEVIHSMMNQILTSTSNYFVTFLIHSRRLLISHQINSGTIGAYVNSIDRMVENYGKRGTLGKKAGSYRFTDMYRIIMEKFQLDEFLQSLYIGEIQNGTYGINIEFLVDFKLTMDDLNRKAKGNIVQAPVEPEDNLEEKTEADIQELRQPHDEEQKIQAEQITQQKIKSSEQNMEMLISKKNRQENYYERLYSDYRTKITVEYDDEYDDLADWEKKPLFMDQQSSDSDLDSEEQKLHLVKNESNTGRERAHLQGNKNIQPHEKYNRKGKVQFVPVRQNEAKKIVERENKKKQYTEKKVITETPPQTKEKKQVDKKEQTFKSKEYDDEQCFQQCKVKVKEEGQKYEERKGGKNNRNNNQKGSKNNNKKKYVEKN